MGHREDLLTGARICLYERGYARTTARDIVAVSGANLASIGYHFGSKDGLMVAAMVEALGEWGDELGVRLRDVAAEPDPFRRLEAALAAVTGSVTAHRPLWMAGHEAFVQIDRSPELRATLSEAYAQARAGLASMLVGLAASPGDEQARTVGALTLALVSGLAAQVLLDPASAPSAGDLVEGIRRLTG